MADSIPCAVEIVRHSRRDGETIVDWIEVIVNGIPMQATSEPRVVHTPLGTHVTLDLTATSVSIRTKTEIRDCKETL
ncbi:hypothetical protein [Nocardia anaemiae]|uniref:hypothetical protein n=1 Tax=Nocardia anaemiae TaxID=263910 RepID=UPI0007A42451|nr:hypothetical protein [Nocardia anaemiae]